MTAYTFTRSGNDWYIDLPEYIGQGGSVGDLQMVDGADTMLYMMAGNEPSVTLYISTGRFDGADVLSLVERCDPLIGGGYYFMHTYEGQEVSMRMWLCQVTAFVLGDIPPEIFVRKVASALDVSNA